MGSFFEVVMLLCFGAAWPVSIYKSWVSRNTAGKSVLFLFIIEVGYLSGIIYKAGYNYDRVIYLYILNAFLVLVDIGLYYRNYVIGLQKKRRINDE